VSELSHDATEDGFHEIQLSGKQIVFLVMVLTVASSVIFLCGVFVGRGVRSQRVEATDAPPVAASSPQPVADSAPATAEPPSPPTETPEDLSYHKRLQGERAAKEAVKPEPPPAAAPPTPAPAPVPAPQRDVPAGGRAGAWIVQVGAFGNADTARDVVRKLAAKGYPAFLANPAPGMPVIYRVRVGGYTARADADHVARRLEKEERFNPVVRQNR
jgi:cell division septation protein DedD